MAIGDRIDVSGFRSPIAGLTQGLATGIGLGQRQQQLTLQRGRARQEQEQQDLRNKREKEKIAIEKINQGTEFLKTGAFDTEQGMRIATTMIAQPLQELTGLEMEVTPDFIESKEFKNYISGSTKILNNLAKGGDPTMAATQLANLYNINQRNFGLKSAVGKNIHQENLKIIQSSGKTIGRQGAIELMKSKGMSPEGIEKLLEKRPQLANMSIERAKFIANRIDAQNKPDTGKRSIAQTIIKNIVNLQAGGENVSPELIEQGKEAARLLGVSLEEITGPRRLLGLREGKKNVRFGFGANGTQPQSNGQPRQFNSEAEANAANLPIGTAVIINGRRGVIR